MMLDKRKLSYIGMMNGALFMSHFKNIHSFFFQTLTKHRPRRRSQQSQASRSFPPDTPYSSSGSVEEEAFFQKPSSPTSPRGLEEGDTVDRGPRESIQPAYRDRLVFFFF